MCEPLLPIEELKNLKWSITAITANCGQPGSYEREIAKLASIGFERRLDWVIANLNKAGEGRKNMGVENY